MSVSTLANAVEEYCRQLCSLSEADLNRPWTWGAHDSEGVRFSAFVLYGQLRSLDARALTLLPPRAPAQPVLQQYLLAYRDLLAVLLGQPASLLEQPPAEGEWSVQRTLSHIASAEVTFTVVCTHGLELFRQGLPPSAMTDEVWKIHLGPHADQDEALLKGPVEGQLRLLAAWHRRMLAAFMPMTEPELDAPVYSLGTGALPRCATGWAALTPTFASIPSRSRKRWLLWAQRPASRASWRGCCSMLWLR